MSTQTRPAAGPVAGATGADTAPGPCSLAPAGTVRQILQRVDRAVHIGERELRYQLEHKHDHPLADSAELLFVLAELEELGLVEAELCFRLTDRGKERLTAPDQDGEAGPWFAAMEDDSVLCADCVREIGQHDPIQAQRAEAIVHAWIDPGPGVCCCWCGITVTVDPGEGVGT